MSLMFTFLLVVQILSALAIVALVLLQQGKGADMGSAFGGGSAGSLFGATGAANFLSRSTKWAAIIFFVSTAALAYVGSRPISAGVQESGVMDNLPPVDLSVPSIPGAASAGSSDVPAVPAAPSTPAVAEPAAAAVPAVPSAPAAEEKTPAAQ